MRRWILGGCGVALAFAVLLSWENQRKAGRDELGLSGAKAQPAVVASLASEALAPLPFDEGAPIFEECEFSLSLFDEAKMKFRRSPDLETHLKEVEEWLIQKVGEERAGDLLQGYAAHLDCEKSLADAMAARPPVSTPEDIVQRLEDIHAFRREHLGEGLADALYGEETDARILKVKREAIISDPDMLGQEKEEALAGLAAPTLSEDADSDAMLYKQYQERLRIYWKDLAEAPDEESRNRLLESLREESFDAGVAVSLAELDAAALEEKELEEAYRMEEKLILEDASLMDSERDDLIFELQTIYFGDDADAFRRREAIRKAEKT